MQVWEAFGVAKLQKDGPNMAQKWANVHKTLKIKGG